jgi:hypothetical protein
VVFDARPPDARPPDAGPPPCTDEITPIEDSAAEDATFSNLSVSKDGHVHVTYIDDLTGLLRYAHRLPGQTAWRFETIAHAAGQLKGQTLDASGALHVAYTDDLPSPRLMYAVREASAIGWTTDVIDDSAIGLDASIAVDARGVVHVVYWYNRSDLNHAVRTAPGGEWSIRPIETEGNVGEFPSLDIGPDGTLHVSYRVGGAGRLDLGYATLAPTSSQWSTSRLDQAGNVGAHTSIDVDALGNAHVSYNDLTNEGLKYAFVPTSGPRRVIFADDALFVGRFTAIQVGGNGTVAIAYYDYGNGDLKFAGKPANQTSFTAVTIDDGFGNDVGRHTSMDLDGFDGAHISYIDDGFGQTNFGDLWYAHICPR